MIEVCVTKYIGLIFTSYLTSHLSFKPPPKPVLLNIPDASTF